MPRARFLLAAVLVTGCAHAPLAPSALATIEKPAFVTRIEPGGGPRSTVFRDDGSSHAARLSEKKLDAKEADRRLSLRLEKGSETERAMNRYQVADSLRAQVLAELPKEAPWTQIAPTTQVATTLESLLVDEATGSPPDVGRLASIGVDAVVEIVIEDFGLRGEKGKAGIFLFGHARLFRLGGGTLYRRAFFSDELKAGLEGLDPFEVANRPSLFSARLKALLEAIAHQIAVDLSPGQRMDARPPVSRTTSAADKPADSESL